MNSLEIQKFGGTSVADARAMEQSGSVVINRWETGRSILAVVSEVISFDTH